MFSLVLHYCPIKLSSKRRLVTNIFTQPELILPHKRKRSLILFSTRLPTERISGSCQQGSGLRLRALGCRRGLRFCVLNLLEEDRRTQPTVVEIVSVEKPRVTVPAQSEVAEAAVLVAERRTDEVQGAVLPPGDRDEILVGVQVTREMGTTRALVAHLMQHLHAIRSTTNLLLGRLVDDQPDFRQVDPTTLDVLVHALRPAGELGHDVEIENGTDNHSGDVADGAACGTVSGEDFGFGGKGREEGNGGHGGLL